MPTTGASKDVGSLPVVIVISDSGAGLTHAVEATHAEGGGAAERPLHGVHAWQLLHRGLGRAAAVPRR